jgi:molybdate/tungstate transport system substrate-binding protein
MRWLSCAAISGLAVALVVAPAARPATPLTVAYAGSMAAVMNKGLGPAFDASHATTFQGIGQGSYGLARLIAAGQMRADVFVAITPGPIRIVQEAGLMGAAVPVASTRMVIAYSPKSRFAGDFAAAGEGGAPWYKVLERDGLRFGRTDPATDPQGRNIVLTMQLAQRYYKQPDLVAQILGPIDNPRQIFAEPSLLTRLESGQLDATSGYLSAVVSHHLPYITLPDEIDLGNPAMTDTWYSHAGFTLATGDGRTGTVKVQPLVFYAGVLRNAAHPEQAAQFVAFLQSAAGQQLLADYGYGKWKGETLKPAE